MAERIVPTVRVQNAGIVSENSLALIAEIIGRGPFQIVHIGSSGLKVSFKSDSVQICVCIEPSETLKLGELRFKIVGVVAELKGIAVYCVLDLIVENPVSSSNDTIFS